MKDKVPFYDVANKFFVGSVFVLLVVLLFFEDLKEIDYSAPIFLFAKDWNLLVTTVLLIVMYEIGFVLNRASSIIVAPILIKLRVWPKKAYDAEVSIISEKNKKFDSMTTELVLTRTHILLYTIVGILSLFTARKWVSILCLGLIVVFVLSGRKHNARINIIRENFAQQEAQREEEQN